MCKKKKYAFNIICIQRDKDFHDIAFRRVLISYKRRDRKNVYHGTRFIDSDPYFKDDSRSHKYIFTDKYYWLAKTPDEREQKEVLNKKRRYHTYDETNNWYFGKENTKEIPWEIEADSDEEAIELFHSRKEKKDIDKKK